MTPRVPAHTLLLTLVCLASASCGDGPRTLHVAESSWQDSLYPVDTDNIASSTIGSHLYETLFKVGTDGEVRPQLARRLSTSADGRTVEITLRTDVVYHDGTPMDATEVALCLRHAAAQSYGEYFYSKAAFYGWPDTIMAADDSTVVFRLPAPHPSLIRTLAARDHSAIARLSAPARDSLHVPPGTGPFRYVRSSDDGSRIHLEAFERYWGDSPEADRIVVHAYPESEDAVAALRRGRLDIVYNVTVGDDEPAVGIDDPVIVRGPQVGYSALGLNSSRPPFRDRQVRQAIRSLLDVDRLARTATKNLVTPTDQFIGSGLYPATRPVRRARMPRQEAAEIVRRAFAALDSPLVFLRPPGSSPQKDHWVKQALEAQLRRYGVAVVIRPMPTWEAYDRVLETGHWDIADDGYTTESRDLYEVLYLLYGFEGRPGSFGLFLHQDPQVGVLLEAARLEADPHRRRLLFESCLERIDDLTPCIPLGEWGIHVMRSPEVVPFTWNEPYHLVLTYVRKTSWE